MKLENDQSAASVPVEATSPPKSNGQAPDENTRDRLLNMCLEAGGRVFRDNSKQTYIRLPIDSHFENVKIDSRDFRRYLRKLWREVTALTVGTSTVDEVVRSLDAEAAYSDDCQQTYIRVAHHNGHIYIDMCDAKWHAIHISEHGWTIINNPPVMFLRTDGMLPLPRPERGGSIDDLQPLLNLRNDADKKYWRLLVAWILATYSHGPFPVLAILGEQGTAKSFLVQILRRFIDPSEAVSVRAPREERDAIIAAANSHVMAIENLSSIPPWLSDLLCCLSTGVAYRERAYHSNDGREVLFKAKRPVVLNGIDLVFRGDLADRTIMIELEKIDRSDRLPEQELYRRLDEVLPKVFGAVLDTLVSILKTLPDTKLEELPRMADFALWVTAAESALNWEPETFMRAFNENSDRAAVSILDSDAFGSRLRLLMQRWSLFVNGWEEVLSVLAGGDRPPNNWPQTGKAVSERLKRLAPALRIAGIYHKPVKSSDGKKRLIALWNIHSGGVEPADNIDIISEKPKLDTCQTVQTHRNSHVSELQGAHDDALDALDALDTSFRDCEDDDRYH